MLLLTLLAVCVFAHMIYLNSMYQLPNIVSTIECVCESWCECVYMVLKILSNETLFSNGVYQLLVDEQKGIIFSVTTKR